MNISNNNNTTTADSNISTVMSMSDCKKVSNTGAPKSNHDTLEMIGQLQNMSTADNTISICANCGKEGNDVNNSCNNCKQVKYCNAVCKKVHKKKHKKDCEEHIRLAAEKHNEELRIAAELHDIELFKQPPPYHEDCPICFLRLPSLPSGSIYMSCCGKTICSGCSYAPVYDDQGNKVDNQKCPFCRTPDPDTEKEVNERQMKRVEMNDPIAIFNTGCDYREGTCGYPQDDTKALELWHRAAELGYAEAYCNIGNAYSNGIGVEVDKKKACHYYELAAMQGDAAARFNLGNDELRVGNMDRALKHYMIAVRGGKNESLKEIKRMYSEGDATKEDYTTALQLYQEYLSEIKSIQRDKAAAFDDYYRYY